MPLLHMHFWLFKMEWKGKGSEAHHANKNSYHRLQKNEDKNIGMDLISSLTLKTWDVRQMKDLNNVY